jgi:anti-anti-sigma factor
VTTDDEFTCHVERAGEDTVLRLAGELDVATAPQLRAAIDAARPRRGTLVLDVAQLSFMDSAGLHLLLDAHAAARAAGHDVVVAGAEGPVLLAMRATGVDLRVPCAPDVGTALGTTR